MQPPKTLAIDFGTKRIGLAISFATLAEPLAIVENNAQTLQVIMQLCEEHGVEQIVLGVSENEMAVKTLLFRDALQKNTTIPIELMDETLSSQQARTRLSHLPLSKRAGRVDHYAAAEFLQEWLDGCVAPAMKQHM